MIDAVISDVGGVLVSFDQPTARDSWAARVGLEVQTFRDALWRAIGSRGVDRKDEIVDRVAASFGLSREAASALVREMNAHWRPESVVLEHLEALRARAAIGVLSNAPLQARFAMEERLGLHTRVDFLGISAELGLEKPNPTAYLETARRMGVEPSRCVFIDDVAENVRSAQEVRMIGIHHLGSESTIAVLDALFAGSPKRTQA